MDVSPSRNSAGSGSKQGNIMPPGRKEQSKSIPKLCGEQIFKQKTESKTAPLENITTASSATEAKSNFSKSKTVTSLQNTTQTKIPMKRTPTTLPSKNASTPRSLQRQQMRSASKISLTIKEVGTNKKLETNGSKINFKANTSANLRAPPVKGFGARPLPPNHSISKRSASTISCRSSRSQKGDENAVPILPKVNSSAGDHETHNLSARERVAENNKLKVFEGLQRKLQDMQTDFMQKFENLKLTSPEKMKTDYKFITMVKNDECRLIIKDDYMLKMPKKLPAESVNDFKERVRTAVDGSLMCLMDSLKAIQNAKNDNDRSLNLEETHNKLEKEQTKKLHDLFECVNALANARDTEIDAQIVRMQKEIQEGKKFLQQSEKKLTDMKTLHSEELEAMEKALKEKTEADTAKREAQIVEMNKKLKSMEKQHEKLKNTLQQNTEETSHEQNEKAKLIDELKSCKENIQTLNKKLSQAENQLSHEKKDKHDKAETLHKLEAELEETKKKMEEASKIKPESTTGHQDKELHKEIHKLKSYVETLETEKSNIELEVERLRQDSNCIEELRTKLQQVEERNRILQEREKLFEDRTDSPKEHQGEMLKLKQSEGEKRREIEKLKMELSKAHFNICQLEEQIQRDQQLLEVRSELINSLQTNDNSQRIHLEEMFAQVGEKNNTINEVWLNNELRTKSEEFRNLFTTLSSKQMELSRQEHMIKLLEESNERSQMLRVKQEEKIGRMEEEIAHLKQTIAIYQNNVLGNAGCKNLIYPQIAAPDDYNENFYYYTSERRRKRQVDINVKKYET